MKPIFKLHDLLQQGEAAISAISPVIRQGLAVLDCTDVESATPEQMTALFSNLPEDWDFADLGEVINVQTLTPSFATQIDQWLERRLEQVEVKPAIPAISTVVEVETPIQTSNSVPLHPIRVLNHVIQEYRDHLRTEFRAKDPQLKAALENALDQPLFLAQEPFFQAHRPFKSGQRWQDLPIDRRLAQVLQQRSKSERAYLHQSEAIAHLLGPDASPLVVTTGTGSGKTESFLLPVIQNAITDATDFQGKPGLTAILIYPMNALANDQLQRIESYLQASGWAGAVSVAKYDRGTTQSEREALRRNPPQILLTNYMMLEYLLVRPADREDIFANHRCRFLVLDEVHTYRGTLGSNIALLVRRFQAHLAQARQDWNSQPPEAQWARRYPELIPVGTSATIKSITDERGLTQEERIRLRDEAVRQFFSKLFQSHSQDSSTSNNFSFARTLSRTIRVLGEELEEIKIPPEAAYPQTVVAVGNIDVTNPEAVRQAICTLGGQPSTTPVGEAVCHARLLWDINRWLIHSPMSTTQIVERVKSEVPQRRQCSEAETRKEVEAVLVVGAALPDDTLGALRLRVHCLIRGGWQFHRCVNPACGKLYPMGEERCFCGHQTAPLYLCRNCGAHYLRFVGEDTSNPSASPLRPSADSSEEHEWMLYDPSRFELSSDVDDDSEDSGLEPGRGRNQRRTEQMRRRPVCRGSFDPRTLAFSFNEIDYSLQVTLAPARTRCLCCGGTAGSRNVVTPIALGTSAAVKVLGEGLVESLAATHHSQPGHDGKERLLVFSDSRQDAAHQARFIIFASRYDRMRRRLLKLLEREGPLSIQRAVELLGEVGVQERDNRHFTGEYTWLTEETRQRVQAWEEAPLLDEISVNAGYRATLVNLGLVQVKYHRLAEYVQTYGSQLAQQLKVSLEQLTYICLCLLDEIRVRGCLSRELLRYHPAHTSCPAHIRAAEWERRMKQPSGYALSQDGRPVGFLDRVDVSPGINVRNPWRRTGAGGRSPSLERILKHLVGRLGGVEDVTEEHMVSLLSLLQTPGQFLTAANLYGAKDRTQLLQVNHEVVRLQLVQTPERLHCEVCVTPISGAQAGFPCPQCRGRLVHWPDSDALKNRMVKRIQSTEVVPLEAGEHTAQVPNDERVDLEDNFKAPASESKLNLLACSPTLEMGIDVGGLDAVILRNVPPRPDNYAQRGGRAGRRTRVGLVIGYARSTPHDQYFYDKPTEMISGEVPAPALALGNRDAIFRHLNAIVFGAAEPGLAGRMVDYVSPNGEIKQEAVDALIAGVRTQFDYAISLALKAWESNVLEEAGLDEAQLRATLATLPNGIQDVINRTARQVQELRTALESYSQELRGRQAAIRSGDLIGRILGIPPDQRNSTKEADDRSAGYPLRRFAEFGILPGYEFPTQPSALRLLGDKYEADPVTVARRFGINQFRPDAQVYARTKRWKVIGLDNASPWNPTILGPGWYYRLCKTCELRFDADHPRCPRCQSDTPGQLIPASEFAGFLARRDESPILDEEERYAARNLVKTHAQWDGDVVGRWTVGTGWALRWSRNEEVRWINEGLSPRNQERSEGIPLLHADAKGYLLCGNCGRMLSNPDVESNTTQGRRRARHQTQSDPFGHGENCPQSGTPPCPTAIVATGKAEVLRLLVPVPYQVDERELQAWGLSLGYALKTGMQHLYMLDGSEIDFEFEGPWQVNIDNNRYGLVALSFIDPSLGGSGYLRRIAVEFHLVARSAKEHLDHPRCETACYRCLKTYQNQRYHELLNWPQVMPALEELSQNPPVERPPETGDINDPRPWLEAYTAGVGSPLELRFLKLFEQHGFHPQKQVPIAPSVGSQPISVADFAVPERQLTIYVDGAAFHQGGNRRRDRFIRDRLRNGNPPWQVVELRAADLAQGAALVERLKRL